MRLFKGLKGWVSGIPVNFRASAIFPLIPTRFIYFAFVFCPIWVDQPMNSNKGAALPRELHLSQKPDSPATNRYTPGAVLGNEGLSIKPFRSKEPLEDEAKSGLETNFRRTIMYIRYGDPNKAIIGMRKFSMLMHQLNEKQLWHGLETLKEVSSDFERGNELRFNASQMLDHVESELWVRLGVFVETGNDKFADPGLRANAFKSMEWLYPKLNKLLAERANPENAVVGDAQEDGKVGAGLPAWNGQAVRIAMEEAAKAHSSSMSEGARQIERKMASAILTIVFGNDNKVDKKVSEAAFQAFDHIDSPVMTDMLTKDMQGFQFGGRSSGSSSAPSAWRESGAPRNEDPDFDIDSLDPRMILRGPND